SPGKRETSVRPRAREAGLARAARRGGASRPGRLSGGSRKDRQGGPDGPWFPATPRHPGIPRAVDAGGAGGAAPQPSGVAREAVGRRPVPLCRPRHAARLMTTRRVEGLIVPPDFMLFLERKRVAELTAQDKRPAIFELREFAESGGLMSYGAYFPELFRR